MGLVRPCRGVEALGEPVGYVEKWAGKAQRYLGAVSGAFSVPQIDLSSSMRCGSEEQEKPTS